MPTPTRLLALALWLFVVLPTAGATTRDCLRAQGQCLDECRATTSVTGGERDRCMKPCYATGNACVQDARAAQAAQRASAAQAPASPATPQATRPDFANQKKALAQQPEAVCSALERQCNEACASTECYRACRAGRAQCVTDKRNAAIANGDNSEAELWGSQCRTNAYLSQKVDCSCMVGEYVKERQRQGAGVPAYKISEAVIRSPQAHQSCARP